MALPITVDSQQFLPWNDDAPLTITSVRTAEDSQTVDIVGGWAWYPGETREAASSNGVYAYQGYKVTFPLDSAPWPLKPRDTVSWVDDDTGETITPTVRSATRNPMFRFWSLDCFRLVAQVDLADSIAVYRPSVTATSDGLRSRSLSAVSGYSAVPGRLQPEGWTEERETDGRILRRRTFKAYLSVAILLEAGDVLRVGSVDYEVTAQSDIDTLGSFTSATCVRVQ